MNNNRKIIIDSNKNVIGLNEESSKANLRNKLHHYTTLDACKNIFLNQEMLARNYSAIELNGSGENLAYSDEKANNMYYINFCNDDSNDSKMWEDFGCDYNGVKITFEFNGEFDEYFLKKDIVKFSNDKNDILENKYTYDCLYSFGLLSSSKSNYNMQNAFKNEYLKNNPVTNHDFSVIVNLSDVEYCDRNFKKENMINLNINENNSKECLIINRRHKLYSELTHEKETRIILLLSSVKNVEIKYMEWAKVNLNTSSIKNILITFGEKVLDVDKNRLKRDLEKFENIKFK